LTLLGARVTLFFVMSKVRFSSISLVLLVSAAFPAFAQDKAADVSVRAAVQDGFVRLVFESPSLPKAVISESGKGALSIQFANAVAFKGLSTATAGISPSISLADDAAHKGVSVTAAGMTRHRTLVLGQRLFVDIFTDKAPNQDTKATAATPQVAEPAVSPPTPVAATSIVDVKPDDKTAQTLPASTSPAPSMPAVPATAVDAVATAAPPAVPAFMGSAVITIGSTQGVALAAFVRSGYLWIVVSQESLSVPPVVSGPSAALIGTLESIKIDGGSAYRVKLPAGAYVRPEGASLVWRLFIEGKQPDLKGAKPERDFSDTAEGPKMHIPILAGNSVLRLPDPDIGDDLAVVTVERSEARLVSSDKYVDFDILPAVVGAVIRPKADGMRVSVMPTEIEVGRQGGLRMTAAGPRTPVVIAPTDDKSVLTAAGQVAGQNTTSLYNFAEWGMGGPEQFLAMRRSIDERVATAPDERKLPELLSGAKFMLAQGLPQEAMGFLQMAQTYMPMLRDSAEFQSIRGAIYALAGQTDEAAAAFATPGLASSDEANLWRAFVLAQQGAIVDAQKALPVSAKTLVASYPERLQALMLPALIEAVLARGDLDLAGLFVDLYDKAADPAVYPDHDSAVAYFTGRLAQLRGDNEGATEAFRDSTDGFYGRYPVKATLALVERGLSAKSISREDAVRKLERFRYGWRGDALESDVLQRLGLIYVTGGEQRRGLTILRDAAAQAPDDTIREKLVSVMQKAFRELFSGKTKEKMTPMESASVAAEFAELMPAGGEGEEITNNIADQMLAVDLLDRAADLIEPLVERTEKMADALRFAQKAAAIRVTDSRPEDAMKIIDKALSRADVQALSALPAEDLKSFALLRAKAKALQKRYDDALVELATIPEDADVLRLKADISWSAARWPAAADALAKLVKLSNLDATRPPTKEQAQMLLNEALALNLAGKTNELETLRIGYGDIMRRSELYQPFQLVTRTAREAKLADRSTLLKLVSEVDLFKGVLDAYKKGEILPPAAATPVKAGQTDQKDQATPASQTTPLTDVGASDSAAPGTPPAEGSADTPPATPAADAAVPAADKSAQ